MAGSNQWVMGSSDEFGASIENDEGRDVVAVTRRYMPKRMNDGDPTQYYTTDEQWHAIVNDIAMAPEVLACLREVAFDLKHHREVTHRTQGLVMDTLRRAEPKRKVRVLVTVEVEAEDNGQSEGVVEYAANQVYASPAVEFISKTATKA
jgi:hypothetical protein